MTNRRVVTIDASPIGEGMTRLAERVITEVKLELVVEDDAVQAAVDLICENGSTSEDESGWVYVRDVLIARQVRGPKVTSFPK